MNLKRGLSEELVCRNKAQKTQKELCQLKCSAQDWDRWHFPGFQRQDAKVAKKKANQQHGPHLAHLALKDAFTS